MLDPASVESLPEEAALGRVPIEGFGVVPALIGREGLVRRVALRHGRPLGEHTAPCPRVAWLAFHHYAFCAR